MMMMVMAMRTALVHRVRSHAPPLFAVAHTRARVLCTRALSTASAASPIIAPSERAGVDARRLVIEQCERDLTRYLQHRRAYREHRKLVKRDRRVLVGPHVSFLFMNYDLAWYQVHEMCVAERGGPAQMEEEIEAYRALVPRGGELLASMFIEIDQKPVRERVLRQLGHIEDTVELLVDLRGTGSGSGSGGAHGNELLRIPAKPLGDDSIERTTPEGKTSAVHFLRFDVASAVGEQWRTRVADRLVEAAGASPPGLTLRIGHANYPHAGVLSVATAAQLQRDLLA